MVDFTGLRFLYFGSRTSQEENYSEMYEEVKNEFNLERLGFEMDAANDSGALKDTSGFSATKAFQLCKKDLESSRDLKK